MKATITKNKPVTLDKETSKLIAEAEVAIKKMDKGNPFKDFEDDRKSRARVSQFPLEQMVGKVTVDMHTCTQEMLNYLRSSSMTPHNILVKNHAG